MPTITVDEAISNAETALSGKFNGHTPIVQFVAKQDDSVVLTHVIQIENDDTGAWFEAFIDAHSGDLVTVTDFVTRASVCFFPSFFSCAHAYGHISIVCYLFRKKLLRKVLRF